MSPPQARMAAGKAPIPEAGEALSAAPGIDAADEAGVGPFVINLVSSTTPMALSHPDLAELKRFSFFVSRRREDNRERFRLHMGYFTTLAEAEEWLNVVRDIYPGAWAGEAPGKKLRARAAAAALAQQLPQPPTAPSPRVVNVTAVTQSPVAAAPAFVPPVVNVPVAAPVVSSGPEFNVPTLRAAGPTVAPPSLDSTATLMAPVLASVPPSAVPAAAAPPSPPQRAAQARAAAPVPAAPRAAPVAAPKAAAAAVATPPSTPAPKATPKRPDALSGSNVREVMAQLDETGETRQMRVPAFAQPVPPAASAPSVARAKTPPASAAPGVPGVRAPGVAPASPRGPAAAAEPPRAKAPVQRAAASAEPSNPSLSDTQVLRFLEQRRDAAAERSSEEVDSGSISLLKPDDTQTRLALKDAVQSNAPVSFAVQLYWSVQPVDLAKVPPLAIFSAYTLYTVEGSREGRKWYGLRLGFFSDAISAKQVAYYVRSEFNSVAVVPVSPQEKVRASAEETRAATGSFARKATPSARNEDFKLFEDDSKAVVSEAPPVEAKAPAKPAAKGPAAKKKPLGKVRAREPRSAKTLEETLEILGASELEIDSGRGEIVNDTGVRHLRVQVQKNTPFAKLLNRLSERVRGN